MKSLYNELSDIIRGIESEVSFENFKQNWFAVDRVVENKFANYLGLNSKDVGPKPTGKEYNPLVYKYSPRLNGKRIENVRCIGFTLFYPEIIRREYGNKVLGNGHSVSDIISTLMEIRKEAKNSANQKVSIISKIMINSFFGLASKFDLGVPVYEVMKKAREIALATCVDIINQGGIPVIVHVDRIYYLGKQLDNKFCEYPVHHEIKPMLLINAGKVAFVNGMDAGNFGKFELEADENHIQLYMIHLNKLQKIRDFWMDLYNGVEENAVFNFDKVS